ncbi:CHAT domain-containing protein [Polaribacter sp. Asnod6-C07]|uniref:CHAT domain-containing protein n=1 Tax=Polaribacter sp. Asnod6-C07 TaxID=3160582 RepID=UPI0038677034
MPQKKNIKRDASDIDLIYFATHGSSDNKNPLDKSFLVLSDENNYDDFLTAREIQSSFFKTHNSIQDKKMAVLSACNTGLGKSHSGGTIGLARAFQIAGFNHVLMSLWSVSDYETAKFMTIFFSELTKSNNSNLEPHNSLKIAINRFRKEVSNNPMHWASFSMFGVPNPDIGSYSNTNSELNYLFEVNLENQTKKLNLNNPDYKFTFKLVPVKQKDTTGEFEILKPNYDNRLGTLLIKENTLAIVEVTNTGKKSIFFKSIEINSEGESYPLLPNDQCNNLETLIKPGETVIFKDCSLIFSSPYEKYTIKGFGTEVPIDLIYKSKSHVINNSEVDGYTTEIIYEIVKE